MTENFVQNPSANLLDNDMLLNENDYVASSIANVPMICEEDLMLQSSVFIEDALHYKTIHHKTSQQSLKLYRWYYSSVVQSTIQIAIILLLVVGFFETPSSISKSSDPRRNSTRYEAPSGYTEGIEIFGLLILLASNVVQAFLATSTITPQIFWRRNPWLCGGFIIIAVSFIDISISFSLGSEYKVCFRRLFRPYFLAQNTTILKKTLKAMWNTIPEIMSVLILLALHLYFFTMFGMLLFPKGEAIKNGTRVPGGELNSTESREYFNDIGSGAMSLLVLLTTANNPDVMIPAYSENRLYCLYFIVFSLIGTFLIFNLLTAIIYNQFRGYFEGSMQASYFRRCVAISAAFVSLLRLRRRKNDLNVNISNGDDINVPISMIEQIVEKVHFTIEQRQYLKNCIQNIKCKHGENIHLDQDTFLRLFEDMDCKRPPRLASIVAAPKWNRSILKTIQSVTQSPIFSLVGNLVVLINAVLMTIEIGIHYQEDFHEVFSRLGIINYIFVAYYLIEQLFIIIGKGKKYFVDKYCLYEGITSLALFVLMLAQALMYGKNSKQSYQALSLWDCSRIVNMLILIRLLRIIPNIRRMALITDVLFGIINSLTSFAGIIIIIYYFFAVLGMLLFREKIDPPPDLPYDEVNLLPLVEPTYKCGSYEQLEYWSNNFNDLAASLVTLWDIMVVNNWQVFLTVYKKKVNAWAQLYFVIWWLISAVVCTNLFVALILDNFIAKWESSLSDDGESRRTVQSLFKKSLKRPSAKRISVELLKHPDLLPAVASLLKVTTIPSATDSNC